MPKCEKILISGFSGSGKSTFLRELEFTNPDQNWFYDDLDQVIMKNHKVKELAELIETHGWENSVCGNDRPSKAGSRKKVTVFSLWVEEHFHKWFMIFLSRTGNSVLSIFMLLLKIVGSDSTSKVLNPGRS